MSLNLPFYTIPILSMETAARQILTKWVVPHNIPNKRALCCHRVYQCQDRSSLHCRVPGCLPRYSIASYSPWNPKSFILRPLWVTVQLCKVSVRDTLVKSFLDLRIVRNFESGGAKFRHHVSKVNGTPGANY